jgi:hypothetical protein
MKIFTREQAIQEGSARYYTGVPCKNGHVSERNTLSGACLECMKENRRRDRDRIMAARAQKEVA